MSTTTSTVLGAFRYVITLSCWCVPQQLSGAVVCTTGVIASRAAAHLQAATQSQQHASQLKLLPGSSFASCASPVFPTPPVPRFQGHTFNLAAKKKVRNVSNTIGFWQLVLTVTMRWQALMSTYCGEHTCLHQFQQVLSVAIIADHIHGYRHAARLQAIDHQYLDLLVPKALALTQASLSAQLPVRMQISQLLAILPWEKRWSRSRSTILLAQPPLKVSLLCSCLTAPLT